MHPFQLALPELCLLQVPEQSTRHTFCLVTMTEGIHVDRVGSYITGQASAPNENDKTSNNDTISKCLARHRYWPS